MLVMIERNYLVAGVRGHPPVVKGRVYGNVDTTNSVWMLEPRASRLSARERTTSSVSTSSNSSYAFISDPEISSSFAASLESGPVSDAEDFAASPPLLHSPTWSTTTDEHATSSHRRHRPRSEASRPVSPGHMLRSIPSSYSSLESLHTAHSGRLLTLHLEKEHPSIWPSLIVGAVPDSLSPSVTSSVVFDASLELEHQYNMDPTSLMLIALELYDIRKDKEEAFEYFLRAWHQAHVPTATVKLVTHYLPLQSQIEVSAHETREPARGTTGYYYQCIGSAPGLARLYLEAGLLYLEGAATSLLASSHSSLSSIRLPTESQQTLSGAEAWKRDREAAAKYFERARGLHPALDIPSLPPLDSSGPGLTMDELQMPSMYLDKNESSSGPHSMDSSEGVQSSDPETPIVRRRRRKTLEEEQDELFERESDARVEDIDNTWYLYLPGLVGAGTAMLVVGVIGALSFQTWRRNQAS
ncbi:hypothetical protein HGRIS_003782 [Hohenbuehelia grisea]